ncbi:MAG TPA: prephenate dehydrogenase/arogenate dehydrogenase family protein [Thermoanaerobaculia bacterium]|nr:prephenate dehydrogenase/arogenate dehydrogenase family protein [Thermoanaerobaculia bacterium]
MQSAPRALIAGLGLIGGSIGIALRARGWRVAFLDPNVTLDAARRAKAADEKLDVLGDADLIILATPVDAAVKLLRTQDPGLRTTSACSVMSPLREVGGQNFIAGHPLAGSHQRGLASARGDLFRGCSWFVDREDALVTRMIGECSARAEIVTADEHDAAVALTSHLPQLLSTALAAYLEQHGVEERFVGSGLRTFLRLAGSDASVWMPVLKANSDRVGPHADAVAKIAKEILAGDANAFERAQRLWRRLLSSAPR